ncbi:MAG TPA: hypothetical protein VHJ58_02210 [Vicinamibacterales bacterium]|jgi:hypothetical protein|nr:hypothetical protein [Vicinamibacterales bacterium]
MRHFEKLHLADYAFSAIYVAVLKTLRAEIGAASKAVGVGPSMAS